MQARKSRRAEAGTSAGLPGSVLLVIHFLWGGDGLRCDESGLVVWAERASVWLAGW